MKENISKVKQNTTPPYKCKICGIGDISSIHEICTFCGWEDDVLQNEQPDYMGGANHMSFNQYKKFWEENKEEIMKENDTCFKAIELSEKYFEIHFKNHKRK